MYWDFFLILLGFVSILQIKKKTSMLETITEKLTDDVFKI